MIKIYGYLVGFNNCLLNDDITESMHIIQITLHSVYRYKCYIYWSLTVWRWGIGAGVRVRIPRVARSGLSIVNGYLTTWMNEQINKCIQTNNKDTWLIDWITFYAVSGIFSNVTAVSYLIAKRFLISIPNPYMMPSLIFIYNIVYYIVYYIVFYIDLFVF